MKFGQSVWRIFAVVTALSLAFLVMFFYGAIGYGSGIDWTYEVFVLTYPGTVLFGLLFWHRSTRSRPAASLFRASALITFFLPPLLLISWTGWIAGFGDAFVSTLNHLALAAVPTILIISAYLIFYRSIRFAWMNVLFLGSITMLQAVITQRGSTSIGNAFSSFSFDDLIIGILIAATAAVIAILNYLAIRNVPEYIKIELPAYRYVPLWRGLAFLALLVAGSSCFGVTARAVQEITQDASRDWSETLTAHIESGDLTALREGLEQRRPGITIAPEALVAGVILGQIETVDLMIKAGADIEGETIIHYQTALTSAAATGDAQMVQTLLTSGADPDHGGEVYIPEEGSYIWITPLSAAVIGLRSDNVDALLTAGATPDMTAGDGMTPLMRAAKLGDIKSVQLLLAAGADLNRKSPLVGRTALHYAAINKKEKAYKALLSAGASPDLQDHQGVTAEKSLRGEKDVQ